MDDRPASLEANQRHSSTEPLTGRGWMAQSDRGVEVVHLTGDWIASDVVGAEPGSIQDILDAADGHAIAFDASQLGRWDSSLLLFIARVREAARQRDIPFNDTGLPPPTVRLLALANAAAPGETTRAQDGGTFVDRVGQAAIDTGGEAVAVMTLVGETILSGGTAMRGRVRMRGVDLLACMREASVAALPIVTVVNLLIGGIVAFVGAVQLRRLGADIFVADLLGVAMVREMVALMTAIIMSGRTGGAYAALIATMLGNEEIDALRVLGIPVSDYLVLPRILALTTMMPLLYLYGCAIGILGGFAVGVAMLNLSPAGFLDEAQSSLSGDQFVFGLVKSLAFGALIAIVGCRSGLSAGRSAADVGRAATRAVVISIVGVIALDAVFAVCANALDI